MNYIMRIANDEFESSVFSRRAYYTAMRRRWSKGTKILFVKKGESGDTFIGYAVVDRAIGIDKMDMNDKKICLDNGWSSKVIFSRLIRLEPPIPVKSTMVGRWPQKGALLHGASISDDDLKVIIDSAIAKINY